MAALALLNDGTAHNTCALPENICRKAVDGDATGTGTGTMMAGSGKDPGRVVGRIEAGQDLIYVVRVYLF